jgi:hypothetical protein
MSVEYVPLSKDQFITFARAVCERRATPEDNPELATADVVNGLANFLHIVAVIAAKELSGRLTLLLNDANVFLCQTAQCSEHHAALYDEENENPSSDAQGVGKGVTPPALDIIRLPLAEIVEWLLVTSGMTACASSGWRREYPLPRVAGTKSITFMSLPGPVAPLTPRRAILASTATLDFQCNDHHSRHLSSRVTNVQAVGRGRYTRCPHGWTPSQNRPASVHRFV